jgi:hypothetical protein
MSNAISGLIYYVTRYGMSQIDGGTRRVYLTITGEWTPNRDEGERFDRKDLARLAADQLPHSFVDGFKEK